MKVDFPVRTGPTNNVDIPCVLSAIFIYPGSQFSLPFITICLYNILDSSSIYAILQVNI